MGEGGREADYTEVILQGLPVTPRQAASSLLMPNMTVCAQWTFGVQIKCLRAIFSLEIPDVKEKKIL